jgi:RHS repeat-associated protein
VIDYAYDHLGRETGELWYANVVQANDHQYCEDTLSYGYDAEGNMTSASDNSSSYTMTYDGSGNMLSSTASVAGLSQSVTLTQAWDYNGNRTSLSATIGTTADFTNAYIYNALGQMSSVEQAGQGGNSVATKLVTFSYDADGRMSTIDRYADSGENKPVAQSTYGYDDDSNLTSLADTAQGSTLASYTWTYDGDGRITQATSTADGTLSTPGTATYTYDKNSQLLSATYINYTDAPAAYLQTYDANGNRSGGGYQTSPDNLVLFDGTYHYEYDAEGNRLARWVQNSSNAGQTAPASGDTDITTYTWDNRNRLTSVSTYSTYAKLLAQTPDTSVAYTYDVFDRMVCEDQTVGSPGTDEYFIYDGQNPVLVLNPNGSVIQRELWGPAVDQILASENASAVVSWMLTDNQGTVRDVAQYNAGSNATSVVDHLVYSAFGAITHQTPGATAPLFTYTGQLYDPITGLYYYSARWYDPATGGFISQDPTGFAAGDANLNRYCGNGPTNVSVPRNTSWTLW